MSKGSKLSFKLKRLSKSLEDFFDPTIYKGNSDKSKLFEVLEVDNAETAILLNRLQTIFKTLMTKLEFAASEATLTKILDHPNLSEILEKYHYRVVTEAFASFPKTLEEDQITNEENNSGNAVEKGNTEGLLYNIITAASSKSSEADKESISEDGCCKSGCMCEEERSVCYSCESTEHRAPLHNAIDILMSYPEILKISKDSEKNISKSSLDFLRQIKFFMEFVLSNAKFTPEKQRENNLYILARTSQVEQIKLEINDLSNTLDEQKHNNGAELASLSSELNKAIDTWDQITSQFQEDLADLIKISLDQQAKSKEEFDEKMENHRQTLQNLKIKIESEKANNAKEESELQGKKFKVESQLTSIIMKFDSEVSERQEECENLTREYRALDEERIQLIKDMEEQLAIHTSILKEREEKANAEFNKKFRKFRRKHAAKVIQRWWRVIYKSLRKKRKKGKKKGKK